MSRRNRVRTRPSERNPNAHLTEDNLSFIFGWMEMCDHVDYLPDGAWWMSLENGAASALAHLKLRGDAFELVYAYIQHQYPDQEKGA